MTGVPYTWRYLPENGFTEIDYIDIRDGEAVGGRRVPFFSRDSPGSLSRRSDYQPDDGSVGSHLLEFPMT